MPEFKKKAKSNESTGKGSGSSDQLPQIIESRCKVCKHQDRRAIDRLIAAGTSYTEIERLFEVDRRSVSNHAQKHLRYEEGAIRRIIEREAERLSENYEKGVQGALARRVYLESALRQAQEDLMSGEITVEPKDAVNIVGMLEQMDSETNAVIVDEIKMQFNAILTAINEVIPPELQKKIAKRAKEIAESDGQETVAIDFEPKVIEAQIVEEEDENS
jgi:hypothetical protein